MPLLLLLPILLLPDPVSLPPSLTVAAYTRFDKQPLRDFQLLRDVLPNVDEWLGETFRYTYREPSRQQWNHYSAEWNTEITLEEWLRLVKPAWMANWLRDLLGNGFCWDRPWYADR